MKYILTFFIACSIAGAFAQRQNVYFFKNNGMQVNVRDSADYTRVVREPDSGSVFYNVMEYYINGNAKLLGKSLTIEPIALEGQCVEFYPDGKRKLVSFYKKNILIKEQYLFYMNGILAETRLYPAEPPVSSNSIRDYLITALNDTLGKPLITNGNGHYKKHYNEIEKFSEEGEIKEGKHEGLWKGYDGTINLRFEELYSDGKLVKGTSKTLYGDSITYTVSRFNLPDYKGGMSNFYSYLGKTLRYPTGAFRRGAQGRVSVHFVVEKDGSLTDVSSNSNVDPELITEALRVMRSSPKWLPGARYGRPVRVVYTVPVVFAL